MSKTKLPSCCGGEMKIRADTGKFWEVSCTACGDVVYIKKPEAPRPLLIDD